MSRPDGPILVTTAPKSPRQEQRERQRRYLVTMAFRVAFFILAIVLFGVGLKWEAGIAIGASLILPWIAVVAANSGPKQGPMENPSLYERERRRQLESGRS